MSDNSDDGRSTAFPDGFVVPIAGLLALLFAVMAGASAYPALSGGPGSLAIPVIFGVASLGFMYLRVRYASARAEQSDQT